ncbi:type III-A CRISPR-associated RAMP protein Csm5 [Thermoanaerobacter kivui]|uniref:type III-A CRISPR-associated RAMP protein Csm5 n=1 Tax=Thermoanaerobacter kivui TaxID=2325 RepID=UPI002ADD9BFD|nr:type III-A CRISPR-associated RAMP protein Csm5 [Thermoanaerobacter kivui]
MSKTYEVEVLTPLVIGSQDKLQSFEFIKEGDFLRVINFDKLFEMSISKEGLIDTITHALETNPRGFRLDDVVKKYAIDVDKCTRYKIKLDGVRSLPNEVVSFVKSAGRAYIPGASLKGAVRSFLTKALKSTLLKQYENALSSAYEKKIKAIDQRRNGVSPQEVDDAAEVNIFFQSYFSPFKFLQISDTEFVLYENMSGYEIKVLNICDNKVKWYNRRGNFDDPQCGLSIVAEGINPLTKLKGIIKVGDGFVLGNEATGGLKDKFVNIASYKNCIEFLAEVINSATEKYISSEIEFYSKYKLTQIVAEYRKLIGILKGLAPNQFLIQLGFSTGYYSKTVGMFFEKESFAKLKVVDNNSKIYPELFPKTRRVVFKSGNISTIPGWVKVTIGEEMLKDF